MSEDTTAATERPKNAGMVPRRIEMPVGMWNEVLEIAKGGMDHKDVLLHLVDLGIQAQSEDRFKPRLVSVDSGLWDRVGKAGLKGATEQDALVYLVDLGLQARAALASPDDDGAIPPDGIRVRVDLLVGKDKLERLAEVFVAEVPVSGDVVSLNGVAYEVQQRAWVLGKTDQTAYLRVERYGEES